MITKDFSLRLILQEPMLGTVPKSKEIYSEFIASKGVEQANLEPKAGNAKSVGAMSSGLAIMDEAESVPELDVGGRGYTGFHTDDKGIFLYDYQIKGFIKEAGNVLKEELPNSDPKKKGISALKSKLDSYVFVFPRIVRINAKLDAPLERPLRAMTMQGPRVTLVKSDQVPAGTVLECTLRVLPHKEITEAVLREVLSYGEFIGLGQWRTGSYGRFTYELKAIN